ncbi:MAG: hypothetical protein EBT13_15820, partial [Rhodobacteraceae bacterium]|nr:hypothetical protein [Paracoccaceae bacterium]
FPVMASSDYASNFAIEAPRLRRLFDKSKFAISTEETRYYLNGVYMHVADSDGGKVLRCVATDGHRLARIDTDLPEGAIGMAGVIVPRKTVGELRKLLDDDELKIAVSVSETKIPKYLLEIASQVDRENAVFLFNSSGDPTLMREGNDTSAVYVVMPMRV